MQVQLLRQWALCAHCDLLLAEALAGEPLPATREVVHVVHELVTQDADGAPQLTGQPLTAATVAALQGALAAAPHASPRLAQLCSDLVQQASGEIQLLERLKVRARVPFCPLPVMRGVKSCCNLSCLWLTAC